MRCEDGRFPVLLADVIVELHLQPRELGKLDVQLTELRRIPSPVHVLNATLNVGYEIPRILCSPKGPSIVDFATAVTAALVVPFALDQEGPASPEDPASSDPDVTLYCVVPGSRPSPTDLAAVVAAALVVPLASGQDAPSSQENFASAKSRGTVLRDSGRPNFSSSPSG